MGTLTLAEMRTELTYYLEGRFVGNARLERWLNQAYQFISYPNIHKHWELEAKVEVPLVANDFDYPLDIGQSYITRELLGVRSGRYVNAATDDPTARRNQLGARSIGNFNETTHTVAGGGPVEYSIFRKTLFVSPIPNSSVAGDLVVLEVWEKPTLLSGDSNTTVLDVWWDEVILLGAKWFAEAALSYTENSSKSKEDFIDMIRTTRFREETGSDDEESYFPDMNLGEPVMMNGRMRG